MSMSWTASRKRSGYQSAEITIGTATCGWCVPRDDYPPPQWCGNPLGRRGRNWVTNFGRLGIRSLGLLWSTMGARLPVQFTRFYGKGSSTLAKWVRGQRENGFRGGGGFHGYP
ncbi:hypothetical protein TNCV_3430991 [Trichonephila clavipes]|nr:hypothetical protein TNCV_3430991 [Trichonephila clavipes]